jgi:hypothetical protein
MAFSIPLFSCMINKCFSLSLSLSLSLFLSFFLSFFCLLTIALCLWKSLFLNERGYMNYKTYSFFEIFVNFYSEKDFMEQLTRFDKDTMSSALLKKLTPFINNPAFTVESVSRSSKVLFFNMDVLFLFYYHCCFGGRYKKLLSLLEGSCWHATCQIVGNCQQINLFLIFFHFCFIIVCI